MNDATHRDSQRAPAPAAVLRSPARIVALVLNWNGGTMLRACLRSALASRGVDLHLVIVDNGSVDGSAEDAARELAGVEVFALGSNIGYARGMNRGITHALERGADYVLFLNNDATVEPDCILNLAHALDSDPTVGLAGPKVLFDTDATRIQYAGGRLSRWTGRSQSIGLDQRDGPRFDQARDVDFVSGCCLLVRATALRRAGLLDERFHHGYEDVEWNVRVSRSGYRIRFVPNARAHHGHARSSGGYDSPFYVYYQVRNRFLLVRRITSPAQRWLWLPFQAAHIARRGLDLVRTGHWASLPAFVRGILDGLAGREGPGQGYAAPATRPSPSRPEPSGPQDRPILVVNPVGVEAGGVQRILLELFRGLHGKDGYRFIVAVPSIGPYERRYQELGVRVEAMPISILRRSLNPLTILRMLVLTPLNVRALRRLIRREGVVLVHTQKMNTLVGDLAARAEGVHSVHSIHEVPLWPEPLYRAMAAPIPRLADRVVLTCEPSRGLLSAAQRDSRHVRLIYNGIALEAPPRDRAELRAGLGVAEDAFFVTSGGRLAPSKGFEFFLEAARQMAPLEPRARFRLIGDIIAEEDAPYRDKIRAQAQGLGLDARLVLEGFRDDYRTVIGVSDVFVLPSLYDTLPSIVIEAMGMGVPVVATRVGGVPEQVEDGVTGILVPPGDAAALREAITRLARDPGLRARMGVAARLRALDVFGIDSYVSRTRALYEELLGSMGCEELATAAVAEPGTGVGGLARLATHATRAPEGMNA
ncbi:MAG: glycosyltransferase [bacterium]